LESVRRQDPHWSLIALLVLTQLAVGMVAAGAGTLVALAVAGMAMAVAPLHLGRPIHAWRAIRNWRRSWLSREVLALTLFAAAIPISPWVAIGAGTACVLCSARIYMVPARPAWNLWFTLSDFYLTCAILGPRLALAMNSESRWLTGIAAAATVFQLANSAGRTWFLARSPAHELRASAMLGNRKVIATRFALSAAAVPLLLVNPTASFALAFAGEILGRYLFFTAVVPKSVASSYLEEAA
jgi:DMSO reductase anchor subunit